MKTGIAGSPRGAIPIFPIGRKHYCAEKDFTGRICRPGDANASTDAAGIDPSQAGRKAKPVNPLDHQLRQVEAENRKLKRKLEKFEAMLDLQKKVSQLLGISLASSEENGDES